MISNNQDEQALQRTAIGSGNSKSLIILISATLALVLTTFLYWPVYQRFPLDGFSIGIDQEINKIDLPIGEDIKEILNGSLYLPFNKHEMCLVNKNSFRFFHADSNSPGVPFTFYTDDLNKSDFGKSNKLGSMAVRLYYQNGLSVDEIYREFNSPQKCFQLETKKLKEYASSTIEYSYLGLARMEELNLDGGRKISVVRNLVGGYAIDTSSSSIYIRARLVFFLATFLALSFVFFKLITLIIPAFIFLFELYKKYTSR
ncbi:MAG: hypothetical protein A2937_00270 [Candidatus Yonathbacteria bacterium RIFCSPLOWO2_01_FULL_47_33b]|uniref:Uncharacterized protein n=1 Tax=Candidatus Yonathbacteria bacterium RIFCSPLOWO2_01_FULL_47_33b TaxID=1802727 RepID=A0A1G2SES8_9BACT|nr:MAG: hypothetical protein A2937_00270 [Candidatus Yonathbacteria bacterium RIFCSPLOWO2_01_FULL_47_33b]